MPPPPRARAPVEPEQIKGAIIISPAPGATKWGWLIDVASNWSVPLIIVRWPRATEQPLRSLRAILNASPSTGEFRWAVRIRGDSIVIARFGLKPSMLHPNDRERSESRAKFALLKELGWPNPTGAHRRGKFRLV